MRLHAHLSLDSVYDTYRGVVTYVRVVDGNLSPREQIQMFSTGVKHELLDIGVISPEPVTSKGLGVGEVGYLITGVKDVRLSRVGDTVTSFHKSATEALSGYKDPKPMVFSGLYPIDGDEYPMLRDALDKLQLNDAALVYEPETSAALGFGFRCGFLGLLHMEIVRETTRTRIQPHTYFNRPQRGLSRNKRGRRRSYRDQSK
jgi:GTP-binding protein LepA